MNTMCKSSNMCNLKVSTNMRNVEEVVLAGAHVVFALDARSLPKWQGPANLISANLCISPSSA